MGEPLVHSIAEVAAMLGISRNSAYQAAARGEIPTIRLGRRIVVPRAKLLALLEPPGANENSTDHP